MCTYSRFTVVDAVARFLSVHVECRLRIQIVSSSCLSTFLAEIRGIVLMYVGMVLMFAIFK